MGFRINTNVAAMNAHANATMNNRNIDSSLSKLSSGLRINSAADDASGMSIADSLRAQAASLGQAVSNTMDANSMLKIADNAMDVQIKILEKIKAKAEQSAVGTQTTEKRKALQSDIKRLTEQLDNIANQTTYNGKGLLSGAFTNENFQVGAYANQTISVSIGATSSDKIGQTRFETSAMGTATGEAVATFTRKDGTTLALESVKIGSTAGTGIGVLAQVINKATKDTGVSASWSLTQTGTASIASTTGTGTAAAIVINGTTVAAAGLDIELNDRSGILVDAINQHKETTGVVASVDARGRLELSSTDGRAIIATGLTTNAKWTDGTHTGRLTLTAAGAGDIQMALSGTGGTGLVTTANEASISLRDMMSSISNADAEAMGAFANDNVIGSTDKLDAGVVTYAGAQAMMKIAQSAQERLDSVRADIGSAQNQFSATLDNISVAQVNVKAAESQIRDVDFAEESANFAKANILAQSGSYAMSQANAVQQNVLRLLQ
ncbi:MAG TPA: flagellin B [Sulfurimonas sp. UBA12504]|nr:MAG: flagellin B [Sulfurimonas sp. GWF2_37_8]DAB31110.1 MAG TPA: flagellin B [Sulfurimonas sp. UBA12504]